MDREHGADQAPDIFGEMAARRQQARDAKLAQADPAEISRLNREAVALILEAREPIDPDQCELLYEQAETLLREAERIYDFHLITSTNWGALMCDKDAYRRPSSGRFGYKRPASWAKTMSERAIHQGSTDGNTFFNMGVALTKLGKPESAQEFFEQSAKLDAHPETVGALFLEDSPRPRAAHLSGFEGRSDAEIVDELGRFFDDYLGETPVVVAFVDRVLLAGRRLAASELVVEQTNAGFRVGLKLSGAEEWSFPDSWVFPTERYRPTVSRFKIAARLDIMQRDVRQQGQYSLETPLGRITLAVSTVPTPDGERVLASYL